MAPDGAIVFERGARAHTEPLFDLPKESVLNIELEFEYSPESLERGGVLFVLEKGSRGGELILWQWKNQLILMSGRDYQGSMGRPRVAINLSKNDLGPYSVLIQASAIHASMSVNAEDFNRSKTLNAPFATANSNVRIIFGTENGHRFPWSGKLYSFSLSTDIAPRNSVQPEEGLIFAFERPRKLKKHLETSEFIQLAGNKNTKLYIGTKHKQLDRSGLQPINHRLRQTNIHLRDLVINFLGFFPIGALVFGLLSSRHWLLAGTAALSSSFLLSLFIELVQLRIPSRDPSQMDLLLNTMGGGFGCLGMLTLLLIIRRLLLLSGH